MRNILSYIIALLLILPFHTLEYVKTVLHVAHHDHDHDHHHDHHHKSKLATDHKDARDEADPDQPVHNHDRDVWGLFANPGLTQAVSFVFLRPFVFQIPPLFEVKNPRCDPFLGSLLRPPIA
jgi:ABC-type nickel/cobalt efflux system permease component RcnA